MTDDRDARLRDLLAVAERAPDEAFVARIGDAITLEARLGARRRALWRRCGGEAAAAAALVACFLLLVRHAPTIAWNEAIPLSSPAMAGLLLLGLGLVVLATARNPLRSLDTPQ